MNRYHLRITLAGQPATIEITGFEAELPVLRALKDSLRADTLLDWQVTLERERREETE